MLPPGTYCLHCSTLHPREEQRAGVTEFVCFECGARDPRALVLDEDSRTEETPRGLKHWTVGALIEDRDGRFLLMRKKLWPYLWDVIAGHLGPDEDPGSAAVREVREETGLRFVPRQCVFHGEIFPDPCRRGVDLHEWHLFCGTVTGDLRPDPREISELRWVTTRDMRGLPFVRPAYFIFDTINMWKTQI